MSRSNIVLTVLLVIVAGVYFLARPDTNATSGPQPRLFPEFNKEAVDQIVIEGGWEKTRWVFRRMASDWTLASAGGYPVKADTVNDFIDAVNNLRREGEPTSSEAAHKTLRVDDTGRTVRILRGDTPMAEFRVGKTPKGTGQVFFVRKEGEQEVYRTRTLLTKDLEGMPTGAPTSPWDTGPAGYRWTDYTKQISDWVDTSIWRLGDAETQVVRLSRAGLFDVTITRKGEDEWELKEAGQEQAVPADTDNAKGFADDLRYLNFNDVLGLYEDVHEQYGLDKPQITLVLTLKQKVEKKEEDGEKKNGDNGDNGDEEEGKDKEKEKDEYKLVKRIVEVGNEIKRPSSIDDDTGEVEQDSYYALHVGGVFDDPEMEKRSKFVFLVDAYTVRGLRKELDDLKQKVEEKKDDEEAEPDDAEKDEEKKKKPDEDADKDKDEKPGDDADTEKPPEEEKKPDETEKKDSDEPQKDEPKKDEPKKGDEPSKEAPPEKSDG